MNVWLRRDRGSLAIEYVIVAPLFLIVFGLIFAFARISQLDGLLDAGARDAARAVSSAPTAALTPDGARQVATDAVTGELGSGDGGCSKVSVQVVGYNVDTGIEDEGSLQPGDIAKVTVTCTYSLSDVGLPVPGLTGLTASAVFASLVDPNRSS